MNPLGQKDVIRFLEGVPGAVRALPEGQPALKRGKSVDAILPMVWPTAIPSEVSAAIGFRAFASLGELMFCRL